MPINFKEAQKISRSFELAADQLNFLSGYIEARNHLKATGSGPAYELGKEYGQAPPPKKKGAYR